MTDMSSLCVRKSSGLWPDRVTGDIVVHERLRASSSTIDNCMAEQFNDANKFTEVIGL